MMNTTWTIARKEARRCCAVKGAGMAADLQRYAVRFSLLLCVTRN
jgi:hypothetical protein